MLSKMFDMFVQSFWETLIMVGISGLIGAALGVPLGELVPATAAAKEIGCAFI